MGNEHRENEHRENEHLKKTFVLRKRETSNIATGLFIEGTVLSRSSRFGLSKEAEKLVRAVCQMFAQEYRCLRILVVALAGLVATLFVERDCSF